LNSHNVEYLIVGGFAVSYHGYPRSTNDIDIWVGITEVNAEKLVNAIEEFGFGDPSLTKELFLQPSKVVRMGLPPMRIEVLTSISGIDFDKCYPSHVADTIDGVPVRLIDLENLKANKRASGRYKDLDDLDNL